MSDDTRMALLHLITTAIDQPSSQGGSRNVAERIVADLEAAGYIIAQSEQITRNLEGKTRTHLWPVFASARRAHCLICGAAYGGSRAKGPCEPPG